MNDFDVHKDVSYNKVHFQLNGDLRLSQEEIINVEFLPPFWASISSPKNLHFASAVDATTLSGHVSLLVAQLYEIYHAHNIE